ncbi:MAG: flagellar hook-associated protein FlgL [Methylococcaceae bacterium]|jgi:flagellar hook-associated protein 3 FlgL
MRISTAFTQTQSVNSIVDQQARLNETQLQLSSGKQVLKPSDNPAAAAQIVNLNHSIDTTKQYQDNIAVAQGNLGLQATTLQSANDAVQRLRELATQALNDSNNANDRKAIANEVDQLNSQLIGLANTRNASGDYLFSGFLTSTPAFASTGNASAPFYSYNGDSNQRLVQIGESRFITDSDPGSNVFGPSSAGGTDSLFDVVKSFSDDLKANTPKTSILDQLSSALDKISNVQSSNGARLNALDRQQTANADYLLSTQTVLSNTQDLDYAQAISKYNLQTTTLQAAQQAFTKVQQLSLFSFL